MLLDRRRIAVMAAGFCSFLDLHAPQSLLPELARQFGATAGQAGWVMAAGTLSVALAAPFAGGIGDRFGRKRTIVLAALLAAIPTALAASSASLDGLIAWRFLQGLLLPAIFAVTVAHVSEVWSPQEAGRVVALYLNGAILGGFSGRFIAGAVADLADWHTSFLVLGGVNLAAALLILAWLPPDPPHRHHGEHGGFLQTIGGHFRNSRLMATCGVGFAVLFAIIGGFSYVNFLLAGPPFGLSSAALGSIFAVYLAALLTTPLSARAFPRFGRRVVMAVATVAGIAGLGLTLVPNLFVIIGGLLLFTGGIFVGQTAGMGFVPQAVTVGRGSAVGLYVTAYYIGGSAGGILPGYLWEPFGWPGCVALISAVMLIGAGLGWGAWRK